MSCVVFSNQYYAKEDPLTNKQRKKRCRNEVTEVSTHPFPFRVTVQAPYQEADVCPALTLLCDAN